MKLPKNIILRDIEEVCTRLKSEIAIESYKMIWAFIMIVFIAIFWLIKVGIVIVWLLWLVWEDQGWKLLSALVISFFWVIYNLEKIK